MRPWGWRVVLALGAIQELIAGSAEAQPPRRVPIDSPSHRALPNPSNPAELIRSLKVSKSGGPLRPLPELDPSRMTANPELRKALQNLQNDRLQNLFRELQESDAQMKERWQRLLLPRTQLGGPIPSPSPSAMIPDAELPDTESPVAASESPVADSESPVADSESPRAPSRPIEASRRRDMSAVESVEKGRPDESFSLNPLLPSFWRRFFPSKEQGEPETSELETSELETSELETSELETNELETNEFKNPSLRLPSSSAAPAEQESPESRTSAESEPTGESVPPRDVHWNQREVQDAVEEYIRQFESVAQPAPLNGVPTKEWIESLRPFLDEQLLSSLSQWSQDPQHVPPELLRRTSPAGHGLRPTIHLTDSSPQASLMESLIHALDETGTDWINLMRKNDQIKRSSWWKSTSRAFRRWSARASEHSQVVSHAIAERSPDLARPFRGSHRGNSTRTSTTEILIWLPFVVAIVGLIGIAPWLIRRLGWRKADHIDLTRLADAMQNADDFRRACHYVCVQEFGWRALFWNHLKAFQELERRRGACTSVSELSQLYERTRYARDGTELIESELQQARKALLSLQGVVAAP